MIPPLLLLFSPENNYARLCGVYPELKFHDPSILQKLQVVYRTHHMLNASFCKLGTSILMSPLCFPLPGSDSLCANSSDNTRIEVKVQTTDFLLCISGKVVLVHCLDLAVQLALVPRLVNDIKPNFEDVVPYVYHLPPQVSLFLPLS